MREKRRDVVLTHAVLVLASIVALYPFASIVSLALHEPGSRVSGFTLPDGLHFGNFINAWTRGGFSDALISSAIVTFTVVTVAVLFSTLAGYALGTLRFPLRTGIVSVFLVGIIMPYEATIISLYHMMSNLGILGSYGSVILPQIGFSVALGVFWMAAYFRSLPLSMIEAASVDGANSFQTLRLVLLPMAAPAVGTLAALLFLYTWNEFLLALVMLADNPSARTAPVALSFFAGNRRHSDPGVTAAAAVYVALPILIAYVFAQRKFVQGLMAGAVKE